MRNSNLNLAHGTKGNPQQGLEQTETQIKSEELENKLAANTLARMLASVKREGKEDNF